MKIKGQLKDCVFKDLKQAEAFVFEGKPYLRIQRNTEGENAVHLESGHLRKIAANANVISKPKASIDLDK